jgi:hypothetical protein
MSFTLGKRVFFPLTKVSVLANFIQLTGTCKDFTPILHIKNTSDATYYITYDAYVLFYRIKTYDDLCTGRS